MFAFHKQMVRWHDTKDKLLAEVQKRRHRASFDAWIIQETWKRTLDAAPA